MVGFTSPWSTSGSRFWRNDAIASSSATPRDALRRSSSSRPGAHAHVRAVGEHDDARWRWAAAGAARACAHHHPVVAPCSVLNGAVERRVSTRCEDVPGSRGHRARRRAGRVSGLGSSTPASMSRSSCRMVRHRDEKDASSTGAPGSGRARTSGKTGAALASAVDDFLHPRDLGRAPLALRPVCGVFQIVADRRGRPVPRVDRRLATCRGRSRRGVAPSAVAIGERVGRIVRAVELEGELALRVVAEGERPCPRATRGFGAGPIQRHRARRCRPAQKTKRASRQMARRLDMHRGRRVRALRGAVYTREVDLAAREIERRKRWCGELVTSSAKSMVERVRRCEREARPRARGGSSKSRRRARRPAPVPVCWTSS